MRSEASRQAQYQWSKAERATVSTVLYKSDVEAFRQYAQDNGTTMNALIQGFVADCLGRPLETRRTKHTE